MGFNILILIELCYNTLVDLQVIDYNNMNVKRTQSFRSIFFSWKYLRPEKEVDVGTHEDDISGSEAA
jgi:hypothetical protein